MPDRAPLAELAPGHRLHSYLLAVRSASLRTTQAGKPYLDLKLGDWSESRSAKIWDVSDQEIAELTTTDFIEITGHIESNEKFLGEVRIQNYKVVDPPEDIGPFLERPKASNRLYQRRFRDLAQSVVDHELHQVLKQVFMADADFWKRFCRAVAAGNMHHAFAGGLLEHTVEVAELCASACEVLVGLDRDLLVTGALMHDIGKMEEMDQELRAGEYTDEGCLIGHLVLGSHRVALAIDSYNETAAEDARISAKTKRALMHLILSHHGLPEHGAAKRPAFAEAAVLYLCDNISAKARQYQDLAAANSANAICALNRSLETYVYLRPVRDSLQDTAGDALNSPFELPADASANTEFVTAATLPVLGLVAAGSPDAAAEARPREFRRVVPPMEGADYLLVVTGDSMVQAGITEGDLLFVKQQKTAKDGDVVVAQIAGEGQTVKRFRSGVKADDGAYLEAANPDYKPIPLTADARIEGKVTGLLRDL